MTRGLAPLIAVLALAVLAGAGCELLVGIKSHSGEPADAGGQGGHVMPGTGGETTTGAGGGPGTGGHGTGGVGVDGAGGAGAGGISGVGGGLLGGSAGTSTGGAPADASADLPMTMDAPPDSPAPTDAAGDGATLPACSVTTDSVPTETLTAAAFCANLLSAMGCADLDGQGYTLPAAYATPAACMASYNASVQQHCQSYHLCGNAFDKPISAKLLHCPHATGTGPCAPP